MKKQPKSKFGPRLIARNDGNWIELRSVDNTYLKGLCVNDLSRFIPRLASIPRHRRFYVQFGPIRIRKAK